MRIGEVAQASGVGVETVRFYQRRKLIVQPLKPRDGSMRAYPEETVARIRFIRRAQQLGFSLREVQELLSLRTDPSSDCADVRRRAEAKRREVDEKIARLKAMRSALDRVIGACPRSGSTRLCSILDELEKGQDT